LDIRGCSDEDMLSKVRQAIQKQPRWLLVVDNADNLDLFGVNRPVEQTISAHSTMAIRGKTRTSLGTLRMSGVSGTNKAPTRATKASSLRSKSIGGANIAELAPSKAKVSRNLRPYIPIGAGGAVLWTTRDEGICHALVSGRRVVNVARMEHQEARQLLSNTGCEGVGDVDKSEDVDQLLEELQWLPLAISQAGAYMRGALMGIDKYLHKLREGQERWKTLKTTYHDPHRRPGVTNSVLETWHIPIEYLRQHSDAEHQLAYKMLHILAYFDNQNIQWELIQAAAEYSKDESQKHKAPDEVTLGRAIKRLKDFSFLSDRRTEAGGGKSFEMHKLVQEGVRYRLGRMAAEAASAEAAAQQASNRVRKTVTDTRLAKRAPTTPPAGRRQAPASPTGSRISKPEAAAVAETQGEMHFAYAALQIINTLFPLCKLETWKQCEKYLAHAMHVGDHVAVCGEALELAALLWRISRYLSDRQKWRERESIDLRLEALLRKKWGDSHPDTLDIMEGLGITYHGLGRFTEAEKVWREILRRRKELFGETHQSTLRVTRNLASVHNSQGRHSEAEELLSMVLSALKKALGDTHPDTLSSHAALAATYYAQGDYDKAEQICVQILKQRQQLYGEAHPDTIHSHANLASTYYAQGYYDKAEQIQVQILKQRQQLYGDTHPDTIYSRAQLAIIYCAQGRLDEAEQIRVQVLEQRQQLLGEAHPDTISSHEALAAIYYMQGHYDEAEQIEVQVLKQRQQLYGEAHPDTISSHAALADTYYAQGYYDEAEQIDVQVLEQRQQLLGDTHLHTLWAKYNLACTQYRLGCTADSIKMMELCLVQYKEALGPDHRYTKDAEDTLNEWMGLQS
jgi:tetratricopeptide (TPR) repeat protein